MLLSINHKGYHQIFSVGKRQEGDEVYHYYETQIESPIVILKATAVLKPGQVWVCAEWKGRGQPGVCRPEHEGLLMVKMYLQRILYQKYIKEDDQVIPLSFQLDEYRKMFRSKIRP